jgi:hypothetical protein
MLEGAGLNSIDFVEARLLINIFEVSHRLYPAAYLSIAATVRAADAVAAFQLQGASQSSAVSDSEVFIRDVQEYVQMRRATIGVHPAIVIIR